VSRPADATYDVADVAGGRAERLLRWYPRPWRDRYGAEFTELLLADISERPRSPRRSLDVMRGGIRARLAEKRPDLISAVAAISPAIWTSYAQAQAANAGAYASAADFAADDAVTHAAALARVPVRIAVGFGDPFLPGVQALARALPGETGGQAPVVSFSDGCHDGSFFTAQEPPSLAFLARRLSGESGGQGEARDRST
jgi:pimeloyl-ACP methyl ester carboxylesterase